MQSRPFLLIYLSTMCPLPSILQETKMAKLLLFAFTVEDLVSVVGLFYELSGQTIVYCSLQNIKIRFKLQRHIVLCSLARCMF